MPKKYPFIIAAVVGTAAIIFALLTLQPNGPVVPPAPPDSGSMPPIDGGQTPPRGEAFDVDHVVRIGATLTFVDGLALTLVKIDDSRCPPDVQCVWAGELSPTFLVQDGTASRELRFGTTTMQTASTGAYVLTLRSATEATATISVAKGNPPVATSDERVRVAAPVAGQLVTSPFVVRGEARGGWYFEATFPVTLLDADGNVVVSHYAQAQGEWMTNDFAPFMSTLNFDAPATATGTLVLSRSNASGLPEHDAEVRIPVRFRADDTPTAAAPCRKTGCSGQICADQDMASDCMFRPEYACYRAATCERQADGECGWTQTPALTQCLQNPPTE